MMRAIAMSLGQEVSMEQRSDSPEVPYPHYMEKTFKAKPSVAKSYSEWTHFHLAEQPLRFFLSALGSSTPARGGGQASQGTSRGGRGSVFGTLYGSGATGSPGAAYLHWFNVAWLLPSSGWATWHSLSTLWPSDDGHQEEWPRIQRSHPRPGCPSGQCINTFLTYSLRLNLIYKYWMSKVMIKWFRGLWKMADLISVLFF